MSARSIVFVGVWSVLGTAAYAQTTAGTGASGAGAPQDRQAISTRPHLRPPAGVSCRMASSPACSTTRAGPRGGDEVFASNWWMGVLLREKGRHEFGVNVMLSLDPWSVGKSGYREIFQVGEELEGKPLVDRQHPHDLFMGRMWNMRMSQGHSMTTAHEGHKRP
jgi:hypothetical protein